MLKRWKALVVSVMVAGLIGGTAVASWAPPIRGGGTQNGVVNPDPKRYPTDNGGGATMDPNPKRYTTHN